MSNNLIERRDGSGATHDFYGDESCSSHMPEKCRACEYDRLKTLAPALANALEELLRLADFEGNHTTGEWAEYDRRLPLAFNEARAALATYRRLQ